MKGLNLKKVAAVTAGVALVAASVTAAVNWSDLVNTADHTMKVNGMVVGDSAAVEDSQAAVLLAGKLAEKAVYDVTTTTTKDVETCVPGSAFEGKTKKYDSIALGTATTGTLTYTNLGSDVLAYESTLSYKVGGATHEASAKETIGFSSIPSFDTSNDVQRLSGKVSAGDLNYLLDLGVGIDFNADSAFTTSTWTDAGAADKVEIPLLGKTYVVHKVTLSGANIQQLELFEKNAIKTYTKGDKIDNLVGKDGKSYYAMIEGVTTGLDSVLTLYDASTGSVVEDYQSEKIGTSDKFAEDVLDTVLEVTDIYNLGTTDIPDYKIEMAVGTEAVTVYEGKGFPYDSTKTAVSDYDWYVSSITNATSAANLETIVMKNTTKYDFKEDESLATGESLNFVGDLAILKFVGLQLPEFDATSPQEVFDIQFGADVSDGVGKGIIYTDGGETKHEVPFYYEFDLDDADSSDAKLAGFDNMYKVDSFEFDGKTYSLKVASTSDENTFVYLFEGSYAASATSTTGGDETTILDLNQNGLVLWDVFTQTSGKTLQIPNSEGDTIDYAIGLDLSENKLWLLLDASTAIATKTGNITFVGTDLNNESTTPTVTFYAPHDDGDFQTLIGDESTAGVTVDFSTADGNNPTYLFDTTRASLAKFTIDLATTGQDDKVTVLVDTATNKVTTYGGSSDTSNAIPGGFQVKDEYSTALYLKKGASNGLESFYDNYGAKAVIDSDDVVTLTIPDQIAYPEFQVIGKGGTAAETCTTASQEVTETVPTVFTGLPFTPIKASEASATGKYVVVGGYMVNALFPAQAEVATVLGAPLAAEGDKVAGVANGNVYIAGYTKEDTQAAVNEVIALLDSTPM